MDLEKEDIREDFVGRWMANDDIVGKTENQRVVTIYRVEDSLDEVKIENLVNTNIFFKVSLDDAGNLCLIPSDKNYVNFTLNIDKTSFDKDVIQMDYEFEGSIKETILEKR